jgi:hypothetical protein
VQMLTPFPLGGGGGGVFRLLPSFSLLAREKGEAVFLALSVLLPILLQTGG